jgi:hypothetical protein
LKFAREVLQASSTVCRARCGKENAVSHEAAKDEGRSVTVAKAHSMEVSRR